MLRLRWIMLPGTVVFWVEDSGFAGLGFRVCLMMAATLRTVAQATPESIATIAVLA